MRPPQILFITANRLGDAVISTGILSHLVATRPGAEVTVACGRVAASLFAPCPAVTRVIEVEKKRWDLHWFDLWLKAIPHRWDLVIDLRGSLTSWLLWTRKRSIMRGGRRPGARIGHLGAVLGLRPPPLPCVWSTPEQEAEAARLLPEGRWLALAPTANWDGKIWPPDRFAAVAKALDGLSPVVVYGPGPQEAARAAPLLAALPGARDLGGDRPLGLVAAVLRRCTLFVGNDSGLMHLAAASGTATLGLFGPSRMEEYGPQGRLARGISAPGPAGDAPIAGLETEAVIAAARALLAEEVVRDARPHV